MRVAITGGPRTGKTTLAKRTGGRTRHTDDLKDKGWSEASEAAAKWFDDAGPWVIEGVAVPRALRKWLRAHPEGRPCDVLVVLNKPFTDRSMGQMAMAKGVRTVLEEIRGELERRGVRITEDE